MSATAFFFRRLRETLAVPPRLAEGTRTGPWTSGLRPDLPQRPEGEPLVSVIILNRNGARLLDALFTSLQSHETWPALEIILVDHASGDESLEVAARWAEALPLRVVARTENHTFSYSNNRAAETARGEFLFLLNNDIVFTEPVIGRMVAVAQATGGLIGVRQYENEPPDAQGRRPWHHVGVRYYWNPVRRFVVPRNAAPWPGDEAVAAGAVEMPAVTGSMMLCRRDDYLAVGGLHEGYVYGYEDIDLCCLFRHRLGRPVISLNDVAALHGDGRTRKTTGTSRQRRDTHRANIRCLDARWGFILWRRMGPAWLADDGTLRGHPPGLVVLSRRPAPRLAEAVGDLGRRGWRTSTAAAPPLPLDLRGVDVAVTADPEQSWRRVWLADPFLVRVGWTVGALAAWTRCRGLAAYDLLVAEDAAGAEALRQAGAARVLRLGEDLVQSLVAARRDGLRLAVVGPAAAARGVATAAGRLGVTAWPTSGRRPGALDAADVVVRLGGAESMPAARPVVDLPLPGAGQTAAEVAQLAHDQAWAAVERALTPPLDRPMGDLAALPSGVVLADQAP